MKTGTIVLIGGGLIAAGVGFMYVKKIGPFKPSAPASSGGAPPPSNSHPVSGDLTSSIWGIIGGSGLSAVSDSIGNLFGSGTGSSGAGTPVNTGPTPTPNPISTVTWSDLYGNEYSGSGGSSDLEENFA